jgi:hypothetical protein
VIKVSGIEATLRYIIEKSKEEVQEQKIDIEESLVKKLEEATPIDTGEASKGWKRTNVGIENSVEYVNTLNAGSSLQAPEYFVERTILSQPGITPSGIIVVNK